MTPKCCGTCHFYNDPVSDYECQYWENCTKENTCSEWKEGYHTHNLRFRIVLLENELYLLREGKKT